MKLAPIQDLFFAARVVPLVATIAALTAVLVVHTSLGAEHGELAVDCDGGSSQVAVDCHYDEQHAFIVAIQATSAPADGYAAFQAMLSWDGAVLDYQPSKAPADEVIWPLCSIPARHDNRPEDSSVLLACSSLPPQVSDYTGVLLLLEFVCNGAGTSPLTLIDREDELQRSFFLQIDTSRIEPALTAGTVSCEGSAIESPTHTATETGATPDSTTPTPPATATLVIESPLATETTTPTASAVPAVTTTPTASPTQLETPSQPGPTPRPTSRAPALGDASCDGTVDALDARLIFEVYVALLASLPCDNVDVNSDGVIGPIDAALILQFAVGLVQSLPP